MKLNGCILSLAVASLLVASSGCGPKAENAEEIKVTPTGLGGEAAGGDKTGGGDFATGNGGITPGKEDVPTPGSQTNTPGNEMPADAK